MSLKKYILSLACTLIFMTPAGYAESESNATKIARAMSAAPDGISAKATIMDMDGSILREGDNGWTCVPGVSLIPMDNHPICHDETWSRWFKAMAVGEPFSTDVVGYSYMLMGDAMVNNDNPAATDQNDGGNWVQEGPHLMLLMPSTEILEGLPRDPYNGGPYVMWDKTPLVHVMVPLGKMH